MNIFIKRGAIPMSKEDNDDYLTPNFDYHDAANPQVSNREEYLHFLSDVMAPLAYEMTIEDLIAVGDKVVVRFTLDEI
jgi:hypothetical protein